MRLLVQMFRVRYDYSVFQIRNLWPLLLSAAGVLLGAATILPNTVSILLGVVAFFLGLGVFVRDVNEERRDWANYVFNKFVEQFPVADIKPPSTYPDSVYLYIPGRGTALVSDVIDQALATEDMPVRRDEEPYRLPRYLKMIEQYVLPKLNAGRDVFNGKIIGMRGDPLPGRTADHPIRLHVARFFDAQCSNEMCAYKITLRNGDPAYDPRHRLLKNANGELLALAESDLADCIGISTIAFTSDQALVLTSQTERNIYSGDLLAPSGSGSLDLRDLSAPEDILQHAVRHGMERELCEETGIRSSEIRSTEVIGFARWLDRGAKPEFLGITRLWITAKDVEERQGRLSAAERRYTAGSTTRRVDLKELRDELTSGVDLASAASLPDVVRESGSLPLLLALRAAALRPNAVTSMAQEQSEVEQH